MSPKIDHPTIGDIQKHAYLTAVITEVYAADEEDFGGEPEESRIDTADIKITIERRVSEGYESDEDVEIIANKVPLFYHCTPDSELRANGALEGAFSAFVEDDEVIVQCEITGAGHYKPLRVMGFMDRPKLCWWRFKLFRDDDTTKRGAGGIITEASGTLIEPTSLYQIAILAGGERVSLHANNYVVKNDDDTYTLKNKSREDFVFGDYWTFSGGIWSYDDTEGYPYDPKTGYFDPANGHYTVSIPPEAVGGLLGYDSFWTFNEEENIWYYDDTEAYPDDPWTGSYNPATEYFAVDQKRTIGTSKVVSPAETAPNDTEFWVTYNCKEHFLPDSYYHTEDERWYLDVSHGEIEQPKTGYMYKYKKADTYETANKIPMGTYEGNVPYWELADQWFSPEPIEKPWNWTPPVACDCTGFIWAPGTNGGDIWFKSPFTVIRILKTSIPYKKQYVFTDEGGVSWRGYGYYNPETGHCGDVEDCTNVTDCGKGSANRYSTMYSTEDGLVGLSERNVHSELPHTKQFITDFIDFPVSIQTEVGAELNIQTQQDNFCYVCPDADSGEIMYISTTLKNVRISFFSRAIDVSILYE